MSVIYQLQTSGCHTNSDSGPALLRIYRFHLPMLTLHNAKIGFLRRDLGTLVWMWTDEGDAALLGDDTAPLGGG